MIEWERTERQKVASEYLNDNTTEQIVFGGGAGGGKSFFGCAWIIKSCFKYPGSRWFIGRKELKRLKLTTLKTFFEILSKWKIGHLFKYNEQKSVITCDNGSEIFLLDLSFMPSDPEFERLGSSEFTGGFVDEAGEIREKAFEILSTRIRYKNDYFNIAPKLLLTCNPTKNFLFREFYKPFKEKTLPLHRKFISALATENQFISGRYIDSLKKIKDKTTRERLLKGNWEYDSDPSALLNFDEISDLFTNPADGGERFLSCDVARMGKDLTVAAVWNGMICKIYNRNILEKSSVEETAELIRKIQREEKIRNSKTIVDEDGVGGGVKDILKCKGFVNNSKPLPVEQENDGILQNENLNYSNLKTQCAFEFARLAKQGYIKIETDDTLIKEKIIEELEQLKVKSLDRETKIALIPKDEIKENIGRSPDFLDSIIMRFYFEISKKEPPQVFFI